MKKADLDEVTQKCTHLNEEQKIELNKLIKKYEFLFDGTLGAWTMDPIDLELKKNVKPYHAKPFPVPKVREET